jgi:quinol-cytochrome oxidoreductase complex cytochrome b subunit
MEKNNSLTTLFRSAIKRNFIKMLTLLFLTICVAVTVPGMMMGVPESIGAFGFCCGLWYASFIDVIIEKISK